MSNSISNGASGPSPRTRRTRQNGETLNMVKIVIKKLAHLPAVQSAGSCVLNVLELQQDIKTNRESLACLAESACDLYMAIANSTAGRGPTTNIDLQFEEDVQSFQECLREVAKHMEDMTKRGPLKRILDAQSDEKLIAQWQAKIRASEAVFQIRNGLSTRIMQQEMLTKLNRTHTLIEGLSAQGSEMPSALQHMTLIDHRSPDRLRVLRALPSPPDVFFGRDDEVATIVKTILKENITAAKIPIVGPGGMGKSALALVVLHEPSICERFQENRYFVRCDTAPTASALWYTIYSALGLPPSNIEVRVEVLAFLGRPGTMSILVLDNFETPWNNGLNNEEVEELLTDLCLLRNVALLITCRGATPPYGPLWTEIPFQSLPQLSPKAAQEMFKAIVGVYDEHAEELLRELDHIPLAIKLICLLPMSTPAELLAHWRTKRTAALQRMGSADTRSTSVICSIQISLDSDLIQKTPFALPLLSVICMLPDGFKQSNLPLMVPSLPALTVVAAREALWATCLTYTDWTTGRIRSLSPIRNFISDNHHPDAELKSSVVNFYLQLATKGQHLGDAKIGSSTMNEIREEFFNIEHVLLRALKQHEDVERALLACVGFGKYMRFSGRGSPDILDRAVDAAIAAGRPDLQSKAMHAKGRILTKRQSYPEAFSSLTEAQRISRSIDDDAGVAYCERDIGKVSYEKNEFVESERQMATARITFVRLGDQKNISSCTRGIGKALYGQGKFDEAIAAHLRSKAMFEELDNVLGQAHAELCLSDVYLSVGRVQEAREALEQCMTKYKLVGHPQGIADCILGLGNCDRLSENPALAVQRFAEATIIFQEIGYAFGLAECELSLGKALLATTPPDKIGAMDALQKARSTYETIGNKPFVKVCDDLLVTVTSS